MNSKSTLLQIIPLMLGFFVMGFCDIVGMSSDYVQRSFGWSATMTGFVPSMVFIWFLFLSIPFANVMNRIGRKNTVIVSLIVTVAGMLLPLFYYDTVTCVLAFALLGIGNTIIQVSLNPLVTNVIKNKRYLTSSLTAGQVVKAVSSLCGPEIVILAVHQWGEEKWFYCFPILGLITIITGIWLWATPIEKEHVDAPDLSFAATFSLLKNGKILMLFLGILFIVGLDVSVNFISSKLMMTRFSWTAADAKFAPQFYFLFRTIGALLGSYWLTRVSETRYFRINIVLCIVSILVLWMSSEPHVSMVAISAIGFFASSVFSIIYSVAMQICPDKANDISGLMMTAVSGGAVITPVIGFCISRYGVTSSVLVILVCALYLALCAFTVNDKALTT